MFKNTTLTRAETNTTNTTANPLQVKFTTLKMRNEEMSQMANTIDAIIKKAETSQEPRSGCFSWLSRVVFRSRSYQKSSQYDAELASSSCTGSSSASSSASPGEAVKSVEVNSRIFGLAGAKKASDPARMLEQAASVMRARIEQLEQRAAEQRSEAARLIKLGQKQAAMRALKKAKQLEASVAANSASLDAVEQQVDLLAQAAVQKTLTSALETTSKTMQKDKKLVSRAEKAVDDVSEVRDMADDLNNAMSELANHGSNDIDEDDLAEELEAMLEGSINSNQVDIDDEAEFAPDVQKKSERTKLTGKNNASSIMKLPSVPKKKKREEKSGLLEADSAVQATPM